MGIQIAEWHGPRMDVKRRIRAAQEIALGTLQPENPRYVAHDPGAPDMACYGDNPSALEAFIKDLHTVRAGDAGGFGWGRPIGSYYVEWESDGHYIAHNVTKFRYAEAN